MVDNRKVGDARQSDVHEDRRRIGRVEYTNAWLIRMMRRIPDVHPDAEAHPEAEVHPDDIRENKENVGSDRDPATGILISMALGTVLWGLIIGFFVIF